MLNRFKCISVVLLAVVTFFSARILRADVTGSLLGIVRDSTQAVVGGARIVVTNVGTNFSKETTSAADGSYRILALPAGTYTVTATAPGFQQFTATNVDVKVNDEFALILCWPSAVCKQKSTWPPTLCKWRPKVHS